MAGFIGAVFIGFGFLISQMNLEMENPTHQLVAAADTVAIMTCLTSSHRLSQNFSVKGMFWILAAGGTFYVASTCHSLPEAKGLIH